MVRIHTVVAGETLSALALRFYGDAELYRLIAAASAIPNPDVVNVRIGDERQEERHDPDEDPVDHPGQPPSAQAAGGLGAIRRGIPARYLPAIGRWVAARLSVLPEFRLIVTRGHATTLPIKALVELGSCEISKSGGAFPGGLGEFGCAFAGDMGEFAGSCAGSVSHLGSVFTRELGQL